MNTEDVKVHTKALSEWAEHDNKRIALVICGEVDSDQVDASLTLIGRTDRFTLAIASISEDEKNLQNVVCAASGAIRNPIEKLKLITSVSEPDKETASSKDETPLAEKLKSLIDKIFED